MTFTAKPDAKMHRCYALMFAVSFFAGKEEWDPKHTEHRTKRFSEVYTKSETFSQILIKSKVGGYTSNEGELSNFKCMCMWL